MDYDNLLEVARKRRSIRRYTKESISNDLILKILEVARWAPSASNSQPWEWIVVKDREKLSKISETLSDYLVLLRRNNSGFPVHSVDYIRNISAVIIVCIDERVKSAWPPDRAEHLLQVSMGAAIQNVLLAATALGIGSVWVSSAGGQVVQPKIKELLDIPENITPFMCIPLGYPNNPPQSRYRRKLENTVHWNKFDITKMRSEREMEAHALWRLMSKK